MALGMDKPRTTGGITGSGGKKVNPIYKADLMSNFSKPTPKPVQSPKSDPKPDPKPSPTPTSKPKPKPKPKPTNGSGGFSKGGAMPVGNDY